MDYLDRFICMLYDNIRTYKCVQCIVLFEAKPNLDLFEVVVEYTMHVGSQRLLSALENLCAKVGPLHCSFELLEKLQYVEEILNFSCLVWNMIDIQLVY